MTLIKSLFVLILVASLAACVTFLMIRSTVDQGSEPDSGNRLKTEQDFHDRVAELRMERDKLQRGIQRLENKKAETMDFLVNDKGIKSSDDITEATDVKYALVELKGWKTEITRLQEDIPKYDEAISSLETMLSDFERRRIHDEVALQEEDYVALRKIVVDLNERLEIDDANPLKDEEMYNMFDEEVKDVLEGEPAPTGN